MEKIKKNEKPQAEELGIDLTDVEEARKAFIASEIFQRKY